MTHVTVLPRRGDWTVADLAELPDDGLRYELVDGTLLVSPAPAKVHQRSLGRLYLLLVAACPPASRSSSRRPTTSRRTGGPSSRTCSS